MEQKSSDGASGSIVGSFVETPYEDQTWEIVGERIECGDFEPMQFETIRTAALGADPMFENYGGIDTEGRAQRWHLPENLAYAPERARREAEQAQEVAVPMVPESDVERMCAEAFERGKQESLAQAQAEYTAKVGEIAHQVEVLLQDLQSQLNGELNTLQQYGVDLAVKVAEKLVGSAVEINPEYIVPLLNEALT
ncbi:MAG: hypothetical protein RL417_390, partial [Pseudomonadota bacterium]